MIIQVKRITLILCSVILAAIFWKLADSLALAENSHSEIIAVAKREEPKKPIPQATPRPAIPDVAENESVWKPIRLGTVKTTADKTALNEPVRVTLLKPVPGRLVYAVTQWKGDKSIFLILHDFLTNSIQDNTTTTFPILRPVLITNAEDEDSGEIAETYIADPLLSPDGRYILFKYAGIESFDNYLLYVLDTQSKKLKLVTEKLLTYRLVSWSPDGNYIAFVDNGDSEGDTQYVLSNTGMYIGPLKLYVCNWRTGQEYLVISNDTISGPFKWIAPHTLLYGALSPDKQKQSKLKPTASKPQKTQTKGGLQTRPSVRLLAPRPDIYEYSVETRKSRLTIADGYHPNPSPDGKWIAFYGSANLQESTALGRDWRRQADNVSLIVSKRDGSGRIAFNPVKGTYPLIIWLADNSRFITLQQTKPSPDAEAQIQEWDVSTQKFRQIATLRAKDSEAWPQPFVAPKFSPINISQDGKTLFVMVTELFGREPDTSFSIIRSLLQTVDLSSGDLTTALRISNPEGSDWRGKASVVYSDNAK